MGSAAYGIHPYRGDLGDAGRNDSGGRGADNPHDNPHHVNEQRRRLLTQYRRFATGAQAIRYAIEDLPAALLRGSIIQVDDDGFDARQIRELYNCPAYPLTRAA